MIHALPVYGFRLLLEVAVLLVAGRADQTPGPRYPMPATTPPPEDHLAA